jgi:hypothetical protein
VALRKRNYSVYEISQVLSEQGTPLSVTAVREVLAEEGFAPLPRRLDEERTHRIGPTTEPVADVRSFALNRREFTTRVGGLFLFVADLVRLDCESMARRTELPGSRMIPSGHALSKITTYAGLDRLDAARITFMTLRRRSARLLAEIAELPPSAWRKVTLDVPHRKYRTPHVYEQKAKPAQRTFRQFFIKDLGHDEPTILLTNDANATTHQLITRYARRMLIENTLADAVRFFHIDALSFSVGLKVDFDMALLVLASGLYRMMAHRMRGYDDAQARQIFRDLVDMPADVIVTDTEVRLRFHRRAHLAIVLASSLFDKPVPVPWWDGRPLRLVQ